MGKAAVVKSLWGAASIMHHGVPAVLSSSGAVQAPWCTMKMCTIVQRAPPVVWWPLTPGAQHDYWGITGPSPHPYTPIHTPLHPSPHSAVSGVKLRIIHLTMDGGVDNGSMDNGSILYCTELHYLILYFKTIHHAVQKIL